MFMPTNVGPQAPRQTRCFGKNAEPVPPAKKGVYFPMALDTGSRKMTFVFYRRGRKFTSCFTAPGGNCAQNKNHRFGRPIKCHHLHVCLAHMRVICTSGPILKDGRSPRRGETALVGNTASQERGNAAMQHSGVSLTPAGGAMGHLRGPASILG